MLLDYQKEFIQFALECGVLKFGQFQLKSGRVSPYFFNTGVFNTGKRLAQLGEYYAKTIITSGIHFDVLFGPAYKGIPLVSAVAIAYARLCKDIPFAFNRKEIKDHGEGGVLVGANLQGKVLIIDDVITAGTSVRESMQIIKNANVEAAAVMISLDRQEKGNDEKSTIQEIEETYQIPVLSIVTLVNIIEFLELENRRKELSSIREYQVCYGIAKQ